MQYNLIISPKAHEDIVEIYNYVKKDGKSLAEKQADVIYESLENLQKFPNIGKDLSNFIDVETNYFYIIIKKSYMAFYVIDGENVNVTRVLSTKQDYLKIIGLK